MSLIVQASYECELSQINWQNLRLAEPTYRDYICKENYEVSIESRSTCKNSSGRNRHWRLHAGNRPGT